MKRVWKILIISIVLLVSTAVYVYAGNRTILPNDGWYSDQINPETEVDIWEVTLNSKGILNWKIYSFSGGPRLNAKGYHTPGQIDGYPMTDATVFPEYETELGEFYPNPVPSGTYYLRVTAVSGYLGNGYYKVEVEVEYITDIKISIGDVSMEEGNSGPKDFPLKASLSNPCYEQVTVQYTCNDNTAKAPEDYISCSGTLIFDIGETTKYINIPVVGDNICEDDEILEVYLYNATNATISDNKGIIVIENDDPCDYCMGDFDMDGDVDGSDLAVFAEDFGRTNCESGEACEGDFDMDGDVDGSDLAVFAEDFGRTDCP